MGGKRGGRGSRRRNKQRRLAERRARKEANRRIYAERMRLGMNTKSKRATRRNKKQKLIALFRHMEVPCGNPACGQCYK